MTVRRIKNIFGLAAAIIVLAVFIQTRDFGAEPQAPDTSSQNQVANKATPTTIEHPSTTNALVLKVVDGDTLEVSLDSEPGIDYKVRMLGINTPETVDPRRPVECFGKEASDYSKKILSGQRVFLEADPQADERDKYNRLLRFVYLEDGTNFNKKMVAEGYAYAYLSFPMSLEGKTEIRRLEREAKEAGRGLWAEGVCDGG